MPRFSVSFRVAFQSSCKYTPWNHVRLTCEMAIPVFPLEGTPNSMDAIESPVPDVGALGSGPEVNRVSKLNGVKWKRPPFSSVATAIYPKENWCALRTLTKSIDPLAADRGNAPCPAPATGPSGR